MDNTEVVFKKIDEVLGYLNKQKELQRLASENGLDIKNAVQLTAESIDNYIVAVISLLLAKTSGDKRYNTLVQAGVQKRSVKTEIINNYKNQAIQLINLYKNKTKDGKIEL